MPNSAFNSKDKKPKIIPVILCGGAGTRLWPLSRKRSPKQFHTLVGDLPLFHQTLERAVACSGAETRDIMTVTTDDIKKETIHQLADFDPDSITHLLSEPCGRNTAAAIAYAALYAKEHFGPDTILWVLPSDHHVENEEALKQALEQAVSAAKEDYLVTFGMTPTRPDTGYGYIKTGKKLPELSSVQIIDRFVEKPNQETAQKYVDEGSYLWNSGMFVFSVRSVLENYIDHCPEILSSLHHELEERKYPSLKLYKNLPSLPFDIAIMEKTEKAAVIPSDIGWSDVGSWESVWDVSDKDDSGNVKTGRVSCIDTEDCFVHANNLLVATIGLKDIAIIENGDSILIADKKNSDAMKTLVSALDKAGAQETTDPPLENRPWGQFRILSKGSDYKVKEIHVRPGGKLSLQMHHHRCEFWTVISGTALVTINGEEQILTPQQSAFIPLQAKHRLENTGTEDLIIVEVQCGNYLGEDDIVRFEDVYGRMDVA